MKNIFVLMMLGPAVAHAAGRVVYNNFESGDAIGKCAIGSSALDGGHSYAGSGMAICNWDGVRKAVDWQDPLADVTFDVNFAYTNEFFFRLQQRADQDYDTPSTGAKWFRFGGCSLLQLDGDSGHVAMCKDDTGTQMSYNAWKAELADAMYSKQWHELEFYFRKGPNGAVKIWQNGILISNYSGDTGSGAQSPLHVGSNWSVNPGWEHDADNHRYVDELEVYSDVGSGASGSMEAGTIIQDLTATPTVTASPVPTTTNTPVPTATSTPVPTATRTPIPTATPTPTQKPTNTPTPTTIVPTAVNDNYSGTSNTTQVQGFFFSAQQGVLANDLPGGVSGRTAKLVSGPTRISGSGTAQIFFNLRSDGSFILSLAAPSSATSNSARQASRRGTYRFTYTMTLNGVTVGPATVTLTVL